MHQGKVILLCALVVSVAMTANAQCVDEGKHLVLQYMAQQHHTDHAHNLTHVLILVSTHV